jgi:hypothetical protein
MTASSFGYGHKSPVQKIHCPKQQHHKWKANPPFMMLLSFTLDAKDHPVSKGETGKLLFALWQLESS